MFYLKSSHVIAATMCTLCTLITGGEDSEEGFNLPVTVWTKIIAVSRLNLKNILSMMMTHVLSSQ